MARPANGGGTTCESYRSIDVRRWHREGHLRPGQHFAWSWTQRGEPAESIHVRTECDAVVLIYRSRTWAASEWKSIEQQVPIIWTACHLGGERPWFVCNGRYCGRRAAVLYGAGELFACRRCYGLAYASQQDTPLYRAIGQAQKIRMKLGDSASLCEPFPEKPKRMHWRTYLKLRARGKTADDYLNVLTIQWLDRRKGPWSDRLTSPRPVSPSGRRLAGGKAERLTEPLADMAALQTRDDRE